MTRRTPSPADRVAEARPALADGVEALPFQPRTPRVELLEQRRQHRLAVDGVSGLERDGRRPARQLGREFALTEVDADADDQDRLRGRHRARFEEDAGDLAAADEDVVRPLQPRLEGRDPPQGLRGGDRGRRRQGRQERLRQPGADEDGRQEAGPGGRLPDTTAAATTRRLLIGDHDRAIRRAALGEREGDRLGGIDLVEADDRGLGLIASHRRPRRGSPEAWLAAPPARRAARAPGPRSRRARARRTRAAPACP